MRRYMAVLERLVRSLESSPVVNFGGYEYFVNPLTDGVPRVDPALLREVIDGLREIGELRCDVIAAPEAMGIPLAVGLSLSTGIPYVVVRKRCYGLPSEVEIGQSTGYSKGCLYLNDVRQEDRVVIVDDVLSTGGTIRPLVAGLRRAGAEVTEVLLVVDKGGIGPRLEKELGVPVKSLVVVEMRQGRPVVRIT
jgi:adenine phosphoribosyltransferase